MDLYTIFPALSGLTIMGYIFYINSDPFDIDSWFLNTLSFSCIAVSIWILVIGSIGLADPDWFTINLSHKDSVIMVSVGSVGIALFILWGLWLEEVIQDCFDSIYWFFKNISNNHKRRNYDYDDHFDMSANKSPSKKYHSSYDYHVILSKSQNIDLDELELELKNKLEEIDGHKYKKGEILKSFENNGYYIIESFDFEDDAVDFRNELKEKSIKSSVCDDEWIEQLEEEFKNNKNLKANLTLKFGKNQLKYFDDEEDESKE